jgi:hypothetical protein
VAVFTYETMEFRGAAQHEKCVIVAVRRDDMHMRDVTYEFAYICTNIYAVAAQQCDSVFRCVLHCPGECRLFHFAHTPSQVK